jgi:hypothetical protein
MLIDIIIFSIILLGLAIGGLAIKILLIKNGEFKKSCSSIDPETGQSYGCSCGSADGGEACRNGQQSAVGGRRSSEA